LDLGLTSCSSLLRLSSRLPPPPQRTPLHCAAKGNTTAVARYLISVGADTEARTAYKMTPLHVAAFYGSAAVVQLLLEEVQDLDINALDFGSCAYVGASAASFLRFVVFLLAHDSIGLGY